MSKRSLCCWKNCHDEVKQVIVFSLSGIGDIIRFDTMRVAVGPQRALDCNSIHILSLDKH
jgi:hypothetical protein